MAVDDQSIVALQRAEHERMEQLLSHYEACVMAEDKRRFYAEIVELVTKHAFAEESVLFPAARKRLVGGDPLTRDIEQKHQRVNELMLEMERSAPGEPAFEERARLVFALLRSDAREEEEALLPALAAVLDPPGLVALGKSWSAVRAAAPNRPHPRVSRRPPWNLLAALPLAVSDRLRKLFGRARHGVA